MIYITKTTTGHLLATILTAAQSLGADQFVLWFYPETTARNKARLQARFQAFMRSQHVVEPITLYEGKPREEYPMVFALSRGSIVKAASLLSKLNRLCDSIATYRAGRPEFVCTTVFHERMTLFKDDPKVEAVLRGQGIHFTETPPAGW